jgi:hypothetical protein
MTGLEALQSVQFATVGGRRIAVVDIEDWETLLDWLETVEDTAVVREAIDNLKEAGGDRAKAGWLRWDDVVKELD